MKDEELEMWRLQWQAQPGLTIELIRRIERESARMRFDRFVLLFPAAVAAVTTIGVAASPLARWGLFAVVLWLIVGFTWFFTVRNRRGVWAPTTETTAAYLELSVERCRRRLKDFRVGRVMAVLVTVVVLLGNYAGLKSEGALKTAAGYWTMAGTYLLTVAVVAFVMVRANKNREKTKAELEYLLNLKEQLRDQELL